MKKWIIIILIVVGIIALVLLQTKWQIISIIAAAVAAPFKFINGLFGKSEEEIHKKHEAIRKREKQYQNQLESNVQQKEERIIELENQIADVDMKLDDLDERRAKVDQEVDNMTSAELQATGIKYFGS